MFSGEELKKKKDIRPNIWPQRSRYTKNLNFPFSWTPNNHILHSFLTFSPHPNSLYVASSFRCCTLTQPSLHRFPFELKDSGSTTIRGEKIFSEL